MGLCFYGASLSRLPELRTRSVMTTPLITRLEEAARRQSLRCVNAHDLCWQGGPCPYCEVVCHRDAHGRFASANHKDKP